MEDGVELEEFIIEAVQVNAITVNFYHLTLNTNSPYICCK